MLRSKAKLLALHLYVKSSMEQAAMVGKPGSLILVLSNAQVLDIFSTELEDMKQMHQYDRARQKYSGRTAPPLPPNRLKLAALFQKWYVKLSHQRTWIPPNMTAEDETQVPMVQDAIVLDPRGSFLITPVVWEVHVEKSDSPAAEGVSSEYDLHVVKHEMSRYTNTHALSWCTCLQ